MSGEARGRRFWRGEGSLTGTGGDRVRPGKPKIFIMMNRATKMCMDYSGAVALPTSLTPGWPSTIPPRIDGFLHQWRWQSSECRRRLSI